MLSKCHVLLNSPPFFVILNGQPFLVILNSPPFLVILNSPPFLVILNGVKDLSKKRQRFFHKAPLLESVLLCADKPAVVAINATISRCRQNDK